MKNKNYKFLIGAILFLIIIISGINLNSQVPVNYQNNIKKPDVAGNLEGAENIIVTSIERMGNVSGYGILNLMDTLTIQNNNDNPIDSIFYGIPLTRSDDLIYYNAYGGNGDSLVVERNYIIMGKYELLVIFLDTPLLPYQSTDVTIFQTFKNLITYELVTEPSTQLNQNFTFTVWPTIPYRAEGSIHTVYKIPNTATNVYYEQVGDTGGLDESNGYHWYLDETGRYDHLDPFLTNIADLSTSKNGGEYISLVFYDNVLKTSEIHIEELTRNVKVSPWGLITVEEQFQVQNHGYVDQEGIYINIPANAKNVRVFDNLGDLDVEFGTVTRGKLRLLINFIPKRPLLTQSSKMNLIVTYNLPPEDYFYTNWIDQSFKIDFVLTQFEFLTKKETINLVVEGCGLVSYISAAPNSIKQSGNSKVFVYYSDYVSPIEKKEFLITYTIDLFDLLLRPILIILAIAVVLSLLILLIKRKKPEEEISLFKKELLPINEIREFCSLYEEKNALILEIRQAEDDAKRKKLARKGYKNIVDKNSSKIEHIKQEIQPFKKLLMDTNETFNNIIKKLDVLDAERISVDDSLSLLEGRYKKGKLPSKAAYEKLTNNFLNRRKKIDRTIDRYIQQFRSYLL